MSRHPALRSGASDIFSWDGHVDRLLQAEAALARAQGGLGVIPAEAADAIATACAADVDRATLEADAAAAATPVIPLLRLLRREVSAEIATFVHHGATSQDIIDTALVLQLRDGMDLLLRHLGDLGDAAARLTEAHRGTVMAGRTLLQHAVPTTFGGKAAHWLSGVSRHVERLRRTRGRLPAQLGGAVGTLAALGGRGTEVLARFAAELGLAEPDLPWHTDRDVLYEAAADLSLVAGTMGKIALDVALLMQTEVGELSDPEAGGSSTMPQKRNPIDPALAIASARLAIGAASEVLSSALQEHERGLGGWHAEWVALPRAADHTIAAVERIGSTLERIEVDADAMRANLDRTGGAIMAESLTFALARVLGREEAGHAVAEAFRRATREGGHLGETAANDERIAEALSEEDLAASLDPAAYLGSTEQFIDRALRRWDQVRDRPPAVG